MCNRCRHQKFGCPTYQSRFFWNKPVSQTSGRPEIKRPQHETTCCLLRPLLFNAIRRSDAQFYQWYWFYLDVIESAWHVSTWAIRFLTNAHFMKYTQWPTFPVHVLSTCARKDERFIDENWEKAIAESLLASFHKIVNEKNPKPHTLAPSHQVYLELTQSPSFWYSGTLAFSVVGSVSSCFSGNPLHHSLIPLSKSK